MGHDTIWRTKRAGDKLAVDTLNVSEEMGSGALLINPGGIPDWVRDPAGHRVRVKTLLHLTESRPCGKCGAELPAGHEVIVAEVHGDSSKLWFVYACATDGCGFVWEQRDTLPAEPESEDEKLRDIKDWLP